MLVDCDAIKAKKYSLSAGQYFEVRIEYVDITPQQFSNRVEKFQRRMDEMFKESHKLEAKIAKGLGSLSLND